MKRTSETSEYWSQLWLFPELSDGLGVEVVGTAESESDWDQEPQGWQHQVWKDAQILYTVMAMFDFEADRRGWELYEVRFQRKEPGKFLAIMKARKGKSKVVAFVAGSSFYDLITEIQETKRREGFVWKEDKWAKK